MRPTRVLHLLSQRPGRTGSGVTLEALVREAARAGYAQAVILGLPASASSPVVGGLAREHVHSVRFGSGPLSYPVPGMSDVMPYESSRFSSLTAAQLSAYGRAWRDQVAAVVEAYRPDLIHAHHLWILASLVKDVAPAIPLVIHSHATGLRQMALCPQLAEEVRPGLGRAERILALTTSHAREVERVLGFPRERIRVVGAGFRDDLFHPGGMQPREAEGILFVGKYSRAKGLPWLLDAFERLVRARPRARLHVAGGGAGAEAEALSRRLDGMGPSVVRHGHLAQSDLADVMRGVSSFVLPSLYEGLPLVVVEAVAAGCRVVATDVPAVVEDLAPQVGPCLQVVPRPRRRGPDDPLPDDLPAFVDALTDALEGALAEKVAPAPSPALGAFTWPVVFGRVQAAWREASSERPDPDLATSPGDR